MKKLGFKALLVASLSLSWFVGCDDSTVKKAGLDGGSTDTTTPGICKPSACPKPEQGISCCTPNAECGTDPTGFGLGCIPNQGPSSDKVCKVAECAKPALGNACCTPLADCGWDPFGNGIFCFPTPPPVDAAPPKPLCDLDKCTAAEGINPCCQLNGDCGWDSLGIGLCFPPPKPLCDLDACPQVEGGPAKCCQLNGKCGVDTLGIGICFAPPPEATCNLGTCPTPSNGIKACCQPNGECGWDSLNIGICFPPPLPVVDAGPPVVTPVDTTPPDDPSITKDCPSFIGLFGAQWGCCSPFGVCGTFLGGQCSLALGSQIPNGPPPPKDSGITEPFLRCTPPVTTADSGTP